MPGLRRKLMLGRKKLAPRYVKRGRRSYKRKYSGLKYYSLRSRFSRRRSYY